MNITETENDLVEVSRAIGSIAGCNGHFTAGLARLLDNGNQTLVCMQIGELLLLLDEYKETFNRVHGGCDAEK